MGSGNWLQPKAVLVTHLRDLFVVVLHEFEMCMFEGVRPPIQDKTVIISRLQCLLTPADCFHLVTTMKLCLHI